MEDMQRVESEVRARGKNLAWLASQLQVRSQDINNWKKRGIPRNKQIAVASVLGWTLDQLITGRPSMTDQTRVAERDQPAYKIPDDTDELTHAIASLVKHYETNPDECRRLINAIHAMIGKDPAG